MADGADNNDKTQLRSVVLGVGAYLPAKTLTNADLETMVGDAWAWHQAHPHGYEEWRGLQ